jgi:ribosome-associated protein
VVRIHDGLAIPDDELVFTVSRSGGPGGQHVNKVSSRVTLRFDVAGSRSLSDDHKRRIAARLATRIAKDGTLRVSCGTRRSQAANRKLAMERFAELIRDALRPRRPRRKTVVPEGARRRRVDDKRRHGRVKRDRSSIED